LQTQIYGWGQLPLCFPCYDATDFIPSIEIFSADHTNGRALVRYVVRLSVCVSSVLWNVLYCG